MVINRNLSLSVALSRWRERRQRWHKWFAIVPVRVGPDTYIWLEWVFRKGEYHQGYSSYWTWTYAADL